MAMVSTHGNVYKRCHCDDQDGCHHAWYFSRKAPGRPRVRGKIADRIGYEPADRVTAEREGRRLRGRIDRKAQIARTTPPPVAAVDLGEDIYIELKTFIDRVIVPALVERFGLKGIAHGSQTGSQG